MKVKAISFPLIVLFCALVVPRQAIAQSDLTCSGITHALSVNWLQFGFTSCNTRFNPNEFILGPTTVHNLEPTCLDGTHTAGPSSPAVANGMLYVATYDYYGNGYLSAFSTNCDLRWHSLWDYPTGKATWSSPAVANGLVFVGGGDNNVYALDARTGVLAWTYTTGGPVWGSPTVADGIVYITSWDGQMYALDAATGTRLWQHSAGQFSLGVPAVAGGVTYIPAGFPDNGLYAVDAKTGEPRWTYVTSGPNSLSSPAVANGVVYIESNDGVVYALNAASGVLKWNASTDVTGTLQGRNVRGVAVANGLVYVAYNDNYLHNLYCFNAATGTLLWKKMVTYAEGLYSSPTVANGVVYMEGGVPGDGEVYAFNASDGGDLWSYVVEAGAASPVVVNGMLYIGTGDGPKVFELPPQ